MAGEHLAKPRFDAVRERQRLELARHFDAAGIRDTGPQRPIILGLLSAIRQFPTAVLDEQRKETLGKVTEAVRQFGIGPCYNGFLAIAHILSEGDRYETSRVDKGCDNT